MSRITMTKKYYKTQSAIQRPQLLKLYSEALADATKSVESGEYDEYYVVQVVSIVRRKSNPVTVDEVR